MERRLGWRAVLVATVVGVLMGAAAGVAYAVPEECQVPGLMEAEFSRSSGLPGEVLGRV